MTGASPATAPARPAGATSTDRPAGSVRRRQRLRRALTGWAFSAPFTVLFLVFMALPVVASLVMSFTDLRSTDLRNPLAVNVVGIDNYTRLFSDDLFLRSSVNTLVFVVVGVPLTMVLALAAATALNSGLVRFRALFRVGFYLPVVTSIVAIAVVWRFLLDPEIGLVNNLLRLVGIDGPSWLFDTRLALPSLIVMAAWRNFGFLMVIFLAGLQAVPADLYEAATLDGATRWQQFRNVTLPMLRPTLLFGGVITGIGYLQLFEEPFVMTQGGPLSSTLSVSFHIYNQFGFGNYGYAAAASYVLFLAIVALSVVQFRLLGERN
ncbi:Lactose transport system permease protein LacF [Micromonospora sp. MW-13]|uniref:carbohydrate ABC transporter permease n=1 Tax=unclassified Micromonospora TaxID=2617518 RepID=UPI000E43B660|nr:MULTISPECIES: sugar ABC transporter permease [unclassified Micromonospora]MCX4471470.1 sugar ABC transporter permease [Micromonospora sp. NBC_01655]RGC65683.1 Lactose transport system permease protein LacF [Micromonospora sp. MW-13]